MAEPEREMESLEAKLNAERMRGNIDFRSIDIHTESGNLYLEVECTNQESAEKIKSNADSYLRGLSFVEFDGLVNPASDVNYVNFVCHNP